MASSTFRNLVNNANNGLIFCLAYLQIAYAWLWDGPQETSAASLEIGSWRPEPTEAPLGNLELFKRQNSIGTSVCGYVSGDLYSSITCAVGYCGLQSALNAVGCCNTYYVSTGIATLTGCGFYTECYDSTAMKQCSGSCSTNSFVLKCTSSADPFCYKFTYTDIDSSILTCSTTKDVVSVGLFTASVPTVTPAPSQSGTTPKIPGSPWITTVLGTESPISVQSGPVTASLASATTSPVSGGSSSHVGATAAGVIGSAALVLILVGILLYFCFRKKGQR